jgi:hypothetical protein
LAPGVRDPNLGSTTACGSNCYVRVTNPANGRCSVAPVWDVGPWFTNDNWWAVPEQRNLNNLPTTVNLLGQGYTGADAAVNGLNVGYGVSGSGRGISNKGYDVANRAGIDIADGTWVDIGLAYSAGIAPVTVTMLWQTGESHTAAAAACGQTGAAETMTAAEAPDSAGDAATLTLSPASTTVGAPVTAAGAGFDANETVQVYWDSTETAPVATANADESGAFTISFNVPDSVAGEHVVIGQGMSSGRQGTVLFGVMPSLRTNPSTGVAGTDVTASGQGFDAGVDVTVYWDRTSTNPGTAMCSATTSSSGTFSCTFRTPSGTAGNIYSAVAVGGDYGASTTFTLEAGSSPVATQIPDDGTGGGGTSAAGTPTPTATPVTAVRPRPTAPARPTDEPRPTPRPRPTRNATATPTAEPTTEPPSEENPTEEAVPATPTAEAAAAPTAEPTAEPTEEPTEEPTAAPTAAPPPSPTEVPTEELPPTEAPPPTEVPAPEPREVVLTPVADVSVRAARPDDPEPAEAVTILHAGGPYGAVTYVTFQVEGVGAGTVIDAKLVLRVAGDAGGAGGTLGVLYDYWPDEASLTYNTAPPGEPSAVYVDWLEPGTEVEIDVTGIVAADGTITFVLTGEAAATVAIGSRESGAPPLLVLTVVDP